MIGIRTPATSGPAIAPAMPTVMLSELAAGSSSGSTSLGMIALRVGWLTAKNACCTENRHSSSHTLVLPAAAWAQNSALVTISPSVVMIRIVRAVEDVGERAAVQPEHDQRYQSEDARESDVRRRAGVGVDLGRYGDHGQLGADHRDDVGEPQPPEVRVAQRAGVSEQVRDRTPSHVCKNLRHRRGRPRRRWRGRSGSRAARRDPAARRPRCRARCR